jgi:hypothetical protein
VNAIPTTRDYIPNRERRLRDQELRESLRMAGE